MTREEKVEAIIQEIEQNTNFTVITEMKAALNSVYGEDRNQITKPSYDSFIKRVTEKGMTGIFPRIDGMSDLKDIALYIESQVPDTLCYQIIIHFPEITISNGDGESHLIKNIYVRLFLKPSGQMRSLMEGMRTTLTEAEFASLYIHSHLPALNKNFIRFQNFCTGVGEINQVLALLSTTYTAANFMMLLMHIKNFLEWESKEGHPYMFMHDVFNRAPQTRLYTSLSNSLAEAAADTLITKIKFEFDTSKVMELFTFDVKERKISLEPTLAVEKWMAKEMENWDLRAMFHTTYSNNLLLSIRDSSGQYHPLNDADINITYENGPILNFKGRNIEFEVTERSQKQTHETFANPKITKEVCKKLSRELTKAALGSPGIKSGSSIVYNTRVAK